MGGVGRGRKGTGRKPCKRKTSHRCHCRVVKPTTDCGRPKVVTVDPQKIGVSSSTGRTTAKE